MTSTDRNDLMPAQEKLEWVTPKILLMKSGKTQGSKFESTRETTSQTGDGKIISNGS
jgi:hypothetical protein